MRHARTALLTLLATLGPAAAGCGGGDTAAGTAATGNGTTLNGTVGPGFDISLDDTDGLTAGSYTLVVADKSTIHNFHLTGPGVDVSTGVGTEGEQSFEIELQAGEYTFVCDPHASQMHGSFTVGERSQAETGRRR